jgi:hypothetical protein
MKINDKYPLVIRDVYSYDLSACHYNIMKKLGYDLSGVDENNKLERNIHIGKLMKKNPELTSKLRETTKAIIDEYLLTNNINENDLVIRQYDGFMTKAVNLRERNLHALPLDFRAQFDIFICSVERNKYLAMEAHTQNVTVKGVALKYEQLDVIYKDICMIRYANKVSIFRQLQKIKDKFLSSKNGLLFGIPTKAGKFKVILREYGEMEISESVLKLIDTDDVDKEFYFKHYLEPFTKSIVFENVR